MFRNYFSSAFLRYYSIKHATKEPIKYTHTINLPKTKFPIRLTAAKRIEVEQKLLKERFATAYCHQEERNSEPKFVLHDGPPYANGDLHVGHAVNKILKDITLRQHVAQGQQVNYIPGWDCHGLPIELKATTAAVANGMTNRENVLSIRKKCRKFALDAVERQKEEFRSWGILADWNKTNSVYLTLKPSFIANQLRMFADLYKRGLVYRDLKPVYWSPSSRTALAEAELEYDPNFLSPSVYVRLPLSTLPTGVAQAPNKNVYALVWTTTPWTLPSNQAICYNASLDYALIELHAGDGLYLIAKNLIGDFEQTTGLQCRLLNTVRGVDLAACTYYHPIDRDQQTLPFFAAPHVQDTKGTGLVHTAPAHGPDDFLVSLEQTLPVISLVDAAGVYTADAPAFLRGQSVLEKGDALVLEHIASDVVHAGKLAHSYPIDWRTKQPVIMRASEQWFINTAELKNRAVAEIEKLELYPRSNAPSSRNALMAQVRKRPYWCISRQRAWGVPIPVFYERQTGRVVTNDRIVQHICDKLLQEGNMDFWWTTPINKLLPAELISDTANELVKGTDIFDIWFDSGSTWAAVLNDTRVADLYLEGQDQFTGWFQSSLLTSVATRNCAPYKALFVHGFTVDEKGHKMSKSLGNIISPKNIISKYGVDVLRWWVASHATQNMAVTVSNKLLEQAAESLAKVRAMLRYLNGVIGERSKRAMLTPPQQHDTYLHKYILSTLVDFSDETQRHYDDYEYNRVVACVQNYVTNELSALYVHTVKDRLYCGNSTDFNNIRYTLTQCYEVLCRALWPIAPFLVEESWSYYASDGSAFHEQRIAADPGWKDPAVEDIIAQALQVKRALNLQVVGANTWTLAVDIKCDFGEKLSALQKLHRITGSPLVDSELCELLQVGSVKLMQCASVTPFSIAVKTPLADTLLCPRCRRYVVENADTTCDRCTNVLSVRQ